MSTSPLVINYLNPLTLPGSLRILISGGDILRPEYVSNLIGKNLLLFNTYGPTETTVCATYYRVEAAHNIIPIGRPIANREIYLMNQDLQLMPIGFEGEICIGGVGVALEYVNNPELTRLKFADHPFANGKKMYRTGDIGVME